MRLPRNDVFWIFVLRPCNSKANIISLGYILHEICNRPEIKSSLCLPMIIRPVCVFFFFNLIDVFWICRRYICNAPYNGGLFSSSGAVIPSQTAISANTLIFGIRLPARPVYYIHCELSLCTPKTNTFRFSFRLIIRSPQLFPLK